MRGLGYGNKRTFIARTHGCCTNCTEGIQPGQQATYAWGGPCHIACLHKRVGEATQRIYNSIEDDAPLVADKPGVCAHCLLKYYVGSVILKSSNRYIHRHCTLNPGK